MAGAWSCWKEVFLHESDESDDEEEDVPEAPALRELLALENAPRTVVCMGFQRISMLFPCLSTCFPSPFKAFPSKTRPLFARIGGRELLGLRQRLRRVAGRVPWPRAAAGLCGAVLPRQGLRPGGRRRCHGPGEVAGGAGAHGLRGEGADAAR